MVAGIFAWIAIGSSFVGLVIAGGALHLSLQKSRRDAPQREHRADTEPTRFERERANVEPTLLTTDVTVDRITWHYQLHNTGESTATNVTAQLVSEQGSAWTEAVRSQPIRPGESAIVEISLKRHSDPVVAAWLQVAWVDESGQQVRRSEKPVAVGS